MKFFTGYRSSSIQQYDCTMEIPDKYYVLSGMTGYFVVPKIIVIPAHEPVSSDKAID